MNLQSPLLLAFLLFPAFSLWGQDGATSAKNKPVVFSAMGCGPYTPLAEEAMAHFLEREGETRRSAFIVHCGDIVTGKIKTWPESQYARVAGILTEGVRIPTFIVPGDNEWNDQLDTETSWELWTKHFLKLNEQWAMPTGASGLVRQQKRPENFAFTLDEVLFLGINKVGGLVHDPEEWETRLRDNSDWLREQFTQHGDTTHSAVIFAQAQAGAPGKGFAKDLEEIGTAYGKPILYLHADGHKWLVEPGKWGAHVMRVQMDLTNEEFPPLQVTVTGDPENPFEFHRRLHDPDWNYQPASCLWSMRAGGDGNDKVRGIATDQDNSIFVTGEITDNTEFGGHILPSAGKLDFVVAKLDPKGHVLWATSAGGAEIDRGYGVSPTGDGGCFVTGHFQSETIQFGETELKNSGDYDGFVARLDGKGNFLWAKRFGGIGYDYGHGIATTPDGTAVVAATITNQGDFGTQSIGIEKGKSAVLAKLTPTGDVTWVQTASGTSTSGHNVAVGPDGAIYLAGLVRGQVTWSDTVSTDNRVQDISIAKYDAAGVFQWVSTAGGESNGLATSVAVDSKSGNLCIAGMFQGTAVFGTKTFTSQGGHDFYAAVLSPEGEFLAAHQGGGSGTDYGLGATALPGGGFAITGEISERGTFHGKPHECAGERDLFVATLTGEGSVNSFALAGGPDHDLSYGIAATDDGCVLVTGAFRNETQFGALKLLSKKGNDIFIANLPLAK
jgi:hypothetical protein